MLERLLNLLAYDAASPLLFNTGLFLVLFVIFLLIYNGLNNWPRAKMIAAILFSLYFYYKSSAECVFILIGVCLMDYALGRLLGSLTKDIWRRAVVALNILVNVGMLVWFKYFNMLAEAFASIVSSEFDPLEIILPAGISFFTFRSISYMVDIYRYQLAP